MTFGPKRDMVLSNESMFVKLLVDDLSVGDRAPLPELHEHSIHQETWISLNKIQADSLQYLTISGCCFHNIGVSSVV